MQSSTCQFPLFNSPLHHLLFFFFLSLCSKFHLFFNIIKNCFLRLIVLFLFSLSLFWKHLQCFSTLMSSTQTSRNGTWPRSLPCKAVRVKFPLFNSPLPTTFLFFSSDKINFYKQFFVSFAPTIVLNLVLPPPCSSFTSCLILQCFIMRKNSTRSGAISCGLKKLDPMTSHLATVLLSAVPPENMSTSQNQLPLTKK